MIFIDFNQNNDQKRSKNDKKKSKIIKNDKKKN